MTLDDRTLQTINDVVGLWVKEGRLFTAFEVSLAVKEQGIDQRHRFMKDDIHRSVASLGGDRYMRTLMDVGAPTDAMGFSQTR